jgi:OOP family OmpA-OmpF porin
MAGRRADTLPDGRETLDPAGDGDTGASGEARRLEELRTLLRGPDWDQVIELCERLSDPEQYAEDVGRALPSAVTLSRGQDQRLEQSLSPIVAESFKDTVRRDPRTFADAIFPVIGPAIRKYIANALAGIVQSINQGLNNTFTPRGLRWRWEAFRTGTSFGEIALRHSLVYRVEQVFLIHKETSLLLEHVVAENIEAQSPDMVAAMLTVIQDYFKDSFHAAPGETFDALSVGDVSVWVEVGPEAILAAVIRGQAPIGLREDFEAALEDIHSTHRVPLESFDGDAGAFASARPRLEECLHSKLAEPVARPPWFALALLSVVVLLLAWWAIPRIIEGRRWHAYQVRLQDEPGIVVTQIGQRDGKRYVAGLRDALAPDPLTFLDTVGLDTERVESRWDPYISLLPDLVLRRARASLDPPAGVTLSLQDGVLIATGSAPTDWINRARDVAPTMPGVVGFEVADQVLSELTAGIQRQAVLFAIGSDTPNTPTLLEEIAAQVRALDVAAQARGRTVTVDVLGSTDDQGDSLYNARLALARAERVRSMLLAAGVGQAQMVAARAPLVPPDDPGEAVRARYRRVSFSIILNALPEGSP